ncbi:MAG: NFACT RNA binding domain-containing protein [Lachnospiraceae bacterium]|nr:NFACT RNA binding domain-containing protein [Lachnospiraceae bacterium]
MAFDGIVISNLVYELNRTILGQKISKIAQPEVDELLLTTKGNNGQYRVQISASASLPFVYLTDSNKPAPLTAPTFCMVLRKHIANGKIIAIDQPGNERIIRFTVEHLDEMGDLCQKYLIVELMGKHSNIIFCSEDNMIIDSIKHVSPAMSSVRTVLPGFQYFIPNTQGEKMDPFSTSGEEFVQALSGKPTTVSKAIYTSFVGISPLLANEIAYRADVDGDAPLSSLSGEQLIHVSNHFRWFMEEIQNHRYVPNIIWNGQEPVEFSCVPLKQYSDYAHTEYDSISQVLQTYYAQKSKFTRIRQKSVDLRKIVSTALERNVKKYDLQLKQLQDAEKREKYRIYGELIQTYGYSVPEGSGRMEAENYYDDNKVIQIPLDPQLSPMENARKYFDKYGKLKRTAEALTELTLETKAQIDHLESIQNALDIAESAEDLVQIKQELADYGFIKKSQKSAKKERVKSKPFHYRSSAGYDIYVGTNNFQNDELTFKMATGNDWWFHAKGIPGSHVIVKANNEELPDIVFEEAGKLAGYYSKGRESDKIEIDYLQKKNVKKPNGAVPGFVVYYTNYSLTIHPDITGIELVED